MVFNLTAVRAPAPGEDPTTTRTTTAAAPVQRPYPPAPAAATALFTLLRALDDGPEREAVRAELVTLWLPMAHRIAGRFRDRGESLEDLRQVAALGLVNAVDRFDPARGAFESYAIPTITGEVRRHFRDRTWALKVPRRIQELRNSVRIAQRELSDLPGIHEPTPADIAAHTSLTEEDVVAGMEALGSYKTLSLDAELASGADGYSLADTMGRTDPAYDVAIDREAAKRELRNLPERDRDILYLRFFEDMTQGRIAEKLGISQMQVSRLITRSCARLRNGALAQ
ncbi:SigB/SigF/SigG family RNA polymerase sigma factor [Streptomyces sp. NPDC095817]|uniref:SigB/SigF/SigG family RNA polymerase sigma factor n=1 Tax=Streptomyces sp. NPDC095817 TaxID=3155082 RepID=UPI003321772A